MKGRCCGSQRERQTIGLATEGKKYESRIANIQGGLYLNSPNQDMSYCQDGQQKIKSHIGRVLVKFNVLIMMKEINGSFYTLSYFSNFAQHSDHLYHKGLTKEFDDIISNLNDIVQHEVGMMGKFQNRID